MMIIGIVVVLMNVSIPDYRPFLSSVPYPDDDIFIILYIIIYSIIIIYNYI